MSSHERLAVLLCDEVVGSVERGRDRTAWFAYTPSYTTSDNAVPLSLTVPVTEDRYEISRWMDGLLPDRLDVREQWARRYKAASWQPFDMLATPIGLDCAGAVQFCSPDQINDLQQRNGGMVPVNEEELAAHLAALRSGVAAPLRALEEWPLFSLAGAQTKTALHLTDSGWHFATGGTPSTHIVKIAMSAYPDNDLVEHVCMATLRRAGIPAADTHIVYCGGERAVAVERFDRRRRGDGTLQRIHQEDMCQALGFGPDLKYQRYGGPAPGDIADELQNQQANIQRFRDALVCNALLAASDAHAKNYSVLLSAAGPVLAPLYDVCSMAPYIGGRNLGDLTLAMSIGSARSISEINDMNAWRQCSEELGLSPDDTIRRVEELSETVPAALTAVLNDMADSVTSNPRIAALPDQIESLVRARRDQLVLPPADSSTELGTEGSSTAGSRKRRTRCPYIGPRTGRQCKRRFRHPGSHRYK